MIGRRLGGRYEIQAKVGGGGMAIVYSGHDLLLDRTVAIKVLRSQFGTDEDFIRRFRREAQAAAKLTHPNVVNIYDVGQEDDIYYIVMEYVEGETLKDLINREAPLSAQRAVSITIQIAEALDNAHHHQIIHRDIKPQNILIGKNGIVKVTDFGIARAVTSATITQTGSVLGSVHYFSPEQAKGGVTGEKSDIYSLGVVLYEMVTGELPFSGESPISVALKHLQEEFKDPKSINPTLPQSLENIVLKALSKDPDLRYRSAREMVKDLETCLSSARMNEGKFQPLAKDTGEDPTIIIPAIRDGAYKRQVVFKKEANQDIYENEPAEDRVRKNRWIKPVVWLGVLVIVVWLGYYLINQFGQMFVVPEVEVPPLENLSVEDAEKILEENGLHADKKEMYHEQIESGYVIKQEPKEGTKLKSGAFVSLVVSLGKQTVAMPDVTKKALREAETFLKDFDVTIEYDYNEDIPADSVIHQDPPVGTVVVPKETKVTLLVSKGGETFEMPSLIGMTLDQARATLIKYGLEMDDKIVQKESYFDKGFVISQWPVQPEEQVSKGTKITIEISSGLREDAEAYTEELALIIESGKETDIEIRITDARYNEHTVFHKMVRETQPVFVDFIVSPQHDATITVYRDGIEASKTTKTYAEIMEGD